MIHQHHAKQRRKHRSNQQQEVLVLGQRRETGNQRADHANRQRQMFDFDAQQNPAGDRRRVNVGKSVFRLVEQDQQQRNPQPRTRQRQEQRIDFATRSERQRVGHPQAHQPEVANKEAQRSAAEYVFGPFAKA